MRRPMFAFYAICIAATLLPAQPSGLEFDVASVHPAKFPSDVFAAGFRAGASSNPCSGRKMEISGTRVSVTMAAICDLIRLAYDVKPYQILGVPAALGYSGQDKAEQVSIAAAIATADKAPVYYYDVEARAPGSEPPSLAQAQEMLRALLRDRFHLTVHRESRESSFYALVPAKNGPKLTPAVEGCKPKFSRELLSQCGQTIEQLAKYLNSTSDRLVLDMTGISGKFDWDFPLDRSDGNVGSALQTAVQENLKLKLEPRKGPLEVLVVDHVERPTEN